MFASREPLYDAVNLGMPIALSLIFIGSFGWFIHEIKKKRLELKSMAHWLVMNIIFGVIVLYTLIMASIHVAGVDTPNLFNVIAYNLFGLELDNGNEWVLLLIFAFISYILGKSLNNSIKIAKMSKRVDELSKQVSILAGKVNKSADYGKTKIASFDKTVSEVKLELKEKIKIAKVERKAKEKLKMLSQTLEIKSGNKKSKKPKK